MHQRVLGTYRHDCHHIIANPIRQSTQSTRSWRSCVSIWDMGSLIGGNAAACAGISQLFRDTQDRHPSVSDTASQVGYLWRSSTFRRWVCVGLWFNFGRVRLIMNVSFQLRHASTATISLQSACTPLDSAIFILVCFIHVMSSSALDQWTLCTQIVISQDTAHSGAWVSSCSASTDISIYAWLVCEGRS